MADCNCGNSNDCVKNRIQASGIHDLLRDLRGSVFRCNSYLVAKNIESIRNILIPYADYDCVKSLLEKADFCIKQAYGATKGLTIEVSKQVNQFMVELQKIIE